MDKGIEVQCMDLSNLTQEDSFVFIYVDVGQMGTNQARNYIESVGNSLKLCRKLETKKIDYAIVARRSDGSTSVELHTDSKAIETGTRSNKEPDNCVTTFNNAMEVV